MKKGLFIFSLLPLFGCNDNSSKCSDPDVKQTAISMFQERGLNVHNEKDMRLENIITTDKNDELKSCGCQATLPGFYYRPNKNWGNKLQHQDPTVKYEVQETDDGEKMVTIETHLY